MGLLRRRWLQILLSGIVLLILVERTLVATSNPNYAPSVILLGAFLVPVTFVTYLYERLPNWDVPLPAVAVCFLWGGVLGTVVAGTLEYDVARALGFLPNLAIGLIEESAKLIVPLVFYFIGRYRSEAAGIVLGVATAAGFAALETMGYGFVSLLDRAATWGARRGVAGARADLTCGAHGLDGIGMRRPVAGEAREGHAALDWRVGGAFLTAVVLHALWDTFASLRSATFVGFLSIELVSLFIAVLSLILLLRRVREARRAYREGETFGSATAERGHRR